MSSFKFQEGPTTEDTLKMLLEALNWMMSKLDSRNVKRLDTNETHIASKDGETVISGPLLLMYDKQGVPVLRVKMGYDADSLDFVFQLMNATGDITIDIDSNGNITVERGTFKGSITIGSGNNVFKADSNGIYLGHAVFASAPFRVAMDGSAVVTNITIIGGTFKTADDGNDRIVFDGNGITSYNDIDQKEGFAVETGDYGYSRVVLYAAGLPMGGSEYNTLGVYAIFTNNDVNMYIMPDGPNNRIYGNWNCSNAILTDLTNGVSPYATEAFVTSQGYITGTTGASGTFTSQDGKTITVSDGLIVSIT